MLGAMTKQKWQINCTKEKKETDIFLSASKAKAEWKMGWREQIHHALASLL